MKIKFNELLTNSGYDISDVRLLRHKDNSALNGRTPFELWMNNRPQFDLYQSIQRIMNRNKLKATYWASFLGTQNGHTVFIGMYHVKYKGLLEHDTPKPQNDGIDLAGSCDEYELTLQENLKEYIGKLIIDWGSGAKAWIQRADKQDKDVIEILSDVIENDPPRIKNRSRNPRWSRDELILALDLYFKVNPNHTSEKHPAIIELSDILNSLPIHPLSGHGEKFRNPNGVYMKLCNFLRLDPEYEGTGLTRGGKLEEMIWNDFANDKPGLQKIATAIKSAIADVPPPSDVKEAEIDEDEEFVEGRLLSQLHKRRERNPLVAKKKKNKVFKDKGNLACEVCGFDFQKQYGDLGRGFAECHHKSPLSDLTQATTTKLSDLAIVCANCHRMLHRIRPWKNIEQLQNIFAIFSKI